MSPVFDVAVVGFGPSGAVAAGLLGMAGLKTCVCARQREVYDKPRAIAMDHEILRVLQRLDVLDAIAPHMEPFTDSEFFGVDGRLIRRMTMLPPPHPQAHVPSVVFTQPPVEQALRERARSLPNVEVALGLELLSLAQDADGVTLQLKGDDGALRSVRARYVIGCDGASSTVRALTGLPLIDLQFDEPWLVVDVRVNERGLAKLPKTSVQFCEPERPCTLVIGPGNHRRWEISLKEGEDPKEAATPERTWQLLSRWLTPEDGELWRQASYRFHALVAERWREGRVFLAGDAAHQQPPFLGQGMCQGVRDVANLAWKLEAVLAGRAGDALLDSYGDERRRHVEQLTGRIKHIGEVVGERDLEKARLRDATLLAECGGVVKDTPRQDVQPRLDSGLVARAEQPARGAIFPQPWLQAGGGARVRMDDAVGRGWRLVLAEGAPELAVPPALAQRLQLRVLRLGSAELRESEGVVADWFHRHGAVAALVRPDHYVYGTAADGDELQALLDELAPRLG